MYNQNSKVYKLFISHSSPGEEEYHQLVMRLNQVSDFLWENTAVPGRVNYDNLEEQITSSHVLIILSGLITSYQELIQKQIKIAMKLNKPILVIRPFGMENVPPYLENIATRVVGWNGPCIVDAIKTVLGEEDDW